MKNLNQYINESLLDNEDDVVMNTANPEDTIKDWIKENTLAFKIKIYKGNSEYPFFVDASNILMDRDPKITSLTNGLFKWGKVSKFSCQFCDNLQSLEGAPEKCENFSCGNCNSLKSLKGAPQECEQFDCSNCNKLESLEGAPQECNEFNCEECKNLKTLKGGPSKVGRYLISGCGLITELNSNLSQCIELFCNNCVSLKSLKGVPKNISSVHAGNTNITNLIGLQHTINMRAIIVDNCSKLTSLKGAPEKCETLTCTGCDNLTDISDCPKTIALDLYLNDCESLKTLKGLETVNFCTFIHLIDCPQIKSIDYTPKVYNSITVTDEYHNWSSEEIKKYKLIVQ